MSHVRLRRLYTFLGAVMSFVAVTRTLAAASPDSSAVAATVERFHSALEAGDSATALALLADDVVILESGTLESRNAYRAHHLPADIAFARAVPSRRGALVVKIQGDIAWVTGTSASQGEYRGRPINSTGAELVVLSRDTAGLWKIRAIHWSSRTTKSPG